MSKLQISISDATTDYVFFNPSYITPYAMTHEARNALIRCFPDANEFDMSIQDNGERIAFTFETPLDVDGTLAHITAHGDCYQDRYLMNRLQISYMEKLYDVPSTIKGGAERGTPALMSVIRNLNKSPKSESAVSISETGIKKMLVNMFENVLPYRSSRHALIWKAFGQKDPSMKSADIIAALTQAGARKVRHNGDWYKVTERAQ